MTKCISVCVLECELMCYSVSLLSPLCFCLDRKSVQCVCALPPDEMCFFFFFQIDFSALFCLR